jgi:hypothetical protein
MLTAGNDYQFATSDAFPLPIRVIADIEPRSINIYPASTTPGSLLLGPGPLLMWPLPLNTHTKVYSLRCKRCGVPGGFPEI